MHHMSLLSFCLLRKNLGNFREFLGKWFTASPTKNCPYTYDDIHVISVRAVSSGLITQVFSLHVEFQTTRQLDVVYKKDHGFTSSMRNFGLNFVYLFIP